MTELETSLKWNFFEIWIMVIDVLVFIFTFQILILHRKGICRFEMIVVAVVMVLQEEWCQ